LALGALQVLGGGSESFTLNSLDKQFRNSDFIRTKLKTKEGRVYKYVSNDDRGSIDYYLETKGALGIGNDVVNIKGGIGGNATDVAILEMDSIISSYEFFALSLSLSLSLSKGC
jgi:hypothetical protein